MKPREILDRATTPDGELLELTKEGDHYVIRVRGATLMSSATYGSEQAMAAIAAEHVGDLERCRVLIGGLGMGFTCRAALDQFGDDVRITVAELLPVLVGYNRDLLGDLAGHPLRDRRVDLFAGDVRVPIERGGWDAILLDVDNGPDALTTRTNRGLYDEGGASRMARALAPGGILVVWSASASDRFEALLRRVGLITETRRVPARSGLRRGPRHTLFIGRAPPRRTE